MRNPKALLFLMSILASGIRSYQSEKDLEGELIDDLVKQGYEFLTNLKPQDDMLANVLIRLQALNDVEFTDDNGDVLLKPI